jgi:hypothetical protein
MEDQNFYERPTTRFIYSEIRAALALPLTGGQREQGGAQDGRNAEICLGAPILSDILYTYRLLRLMCCGDLT